jgi:hypothetical protein
MTWKNDGGAIQFILLQHTLTSFFRIPYLPANNPTADIKSSPEASKRRTLDFFALCGALPKVRVKNGLAIFP